MEDVTIEEFHIGFEYFEYQMDPHRWLNRGMIWVKKVYSFNSPRLYKIQKRIEKGVIKK